MEKLVTITKAGVFKRVEKSIAKKSIEEGWSYTSKKKYKAYKEKQTRVFGAVPPEMPHYAVNQARKVGTRVDGNKIVNICPSCSYKILIDCRAKEGRCVCGESVLNIKGE